MDPIGYANVCHQKHMNNAIIKWKCCWRKLCQENFDYGFKLQKIKILMKNESRQCFSLLLGCDIVLRKNGKDLREVQLLDFHVEPHLTSLRGEQRNMELHLIWQRGSRHDCIIWLRLFLPPSTWVMVWKTCSDTDWGCSLLWICYSPQKKKRGKSCMYYCIVITHHITSLEWLC